MSHDSYHMYMYICCITWVIRIRFDLSSQLNANSFWLANLFCCCHCLFFIFFIRFLWWFLQLERKTVCERKKLLNNPDCDQFECSYICSSRRRSYLMFIRLITAKWKGKKEKDIIFLHSAMCYLLFSLDWFNMLVQWKSCALLVLVLLLGRAVLWFLFLVFIRTLADCTGKAWQMHCDDDAADFIAITVHFETERATFIGR